MKKDKIIIELREKLWFGKHKDDRLIDVIDNNYKYVEKMCHEYDVLLSDDANNYYNKRISKKSSWETTWGPTPGYYGTFSATTE